jgi:hypothetical protein
MTARRLWMCCSRPSGASARSEILFSIGQHKVAATIRSEESMVRSQHSRRAARGASSAGHHFCGRPSRKGYRNPGFGRQGHLSSWRRRSPDASPRFQPRNIPRLRHCFVFGILRIFRLKLPQSRTLRCVSQGQLKLSEAIGYSATLNRKIAGSTAACTCERYLVPRPFG